MKTQLAIPTTPDELTASWLSEALRAGEVLRDAAVVSARCEVLGQGAGFIGQIARVTLTYDRVVEGAPATLIAKMPALEEGARELAGLYGLYEREFRFYREMAQEITFRTARCYYSDGDAETVRYVLLLEDLLASGRAGDQVKGCTPEEARVALSQLGLHHARWWQHPRLTQIPWLPAGIDLVNGAMEQAYPEAWQTTLPLYADRMPQAIRDVLPTLGRRISALMEPLGRGPLTMIHGDYRLDNMFFGNAGSGYELAVLDWQSPNRAFRAYDIAYFLYGNVDTVTRRAHEMDALGEYHLTLVENGVRGYEWEQLVDDYKSSLLVSLGIFVVNAATLDPANDRGRTLFDLFFDRLSAAIMDLDALRLLPA